MIEVCAADAAVDDTLRPSAYWRNTGRRYRGLATKSRSRLADRDPGGGSARRAKRRSLPKAFVFEMLAEILLHVLTLKTRNAGRVWRYAIGSPRW